MQLGAGPIPPMDDGLSSRLRRRITREGPLPFHAFVEAALYDPSYGYYAKGPAIGASGDFYTASNFRAFGLAIAHAAVEAYRAMGEPRAFRIVELGAGTGALAGLVATEMARAGVAARVATVERATGMAAMQRDRGLDVVSTLAELGSGPTFVYANEVLDALPFDRVRRTQAGLLERCLVTFDERQDNFAEEWQPFPSPALSGDRLLLEYGAHLELGETGELAPTTTHVFEEVKKILKPGVALFFDYGAEGPSRVGSVAAYRDHRIDPEILRDPGTKDLTADVDFAEAARAAKAASLQVFGSPTQGRFLIAQGLLAAMMDAQKEGDFESALAIKTLIVPGGMGERFRVLGVANEFPRPLSGFETPDLGWSIGRR
ncbi:MAG: SAM-dependent methyltransferase [Thermoplasmatota archaeon]